MRFICELFFFFFITLFVLLQNFAEASGKEVIYWPRRDSPPLNIIDGKYKEKGITDQAVTAIQKHLPEYEHKYQEGVNLKRTFYEIKSEKKICSGGIIWTKERAQIAYFSIPYNTLPPQRIYLVKDKLPLFKKYIKNNRISLDELLKDKKLKMVIHESRSYGKTLDRIIKSNESGGMICKRYAPNYEGLVAMMLHNRDIDFTIEFPWSVDYFFKYKMKRDDFCSIPISESNEFIESRFAAPKNKWGEGIIRRINDIIRMKSVTEKCRKAVSIWLDKETDEQFQIEFDKMVEKRDSVRE